MKLVSFATVLILMSVFSGFLSPSWCQVSTEEVESSSDSCYVGSVNAIEVGPNGWIYSLNGTDGVYLSWNNGNSWRQIGGSYKLSLNECLAVDTTGRLLVGTSAYGIFAFNPINGSWHRIDTLLREDGYISNIVVDHDDHIFTVTGNRETGNSEIFKSTDAGVHWSKLPIEEQQNSFNIDHAGNLYADTPGAYMISTDGGESWAQTGMTRTSIVSMAVDPFGRMFVAGGIGIFFSEDHGHIWKCCYGGDSSKVLYNLTCIYAYQGKAILAGLKTGGILISTDAGQTWSTSSFREFCKSPVLCIASNPKGYIFVGTEGSGLWRSTNEGKTWQPANKGFISVPLGG